ncbi:universal stress protein [Kitasatospora sp. NPDC048722]|uniref:universal stress protein n=1 Tax=Kitasatospora sp. NPDC048722 TaxID=3155639 RepID=UPI0034046235
MPPPTRWALRIGCLLNYRAPNRHRLDDQRSRPLVPGDRVHRSGVWTTACCRAGRRVVGPLVTGGGTTVPVASRVRGTGGPGPSGRRARARASGRRRRPLRASREAVSWATDEAVRTGRALRLIHVLAWPQTDPDEDTPHLLDDHVRIGGDIVLAQSRKLVEERHPSLETEPRMADGPRARGLLEQAADASLLVVGAKRRPVVEQVLTLPPIGVPLSSHAPCPVAVVRETADAAANAQAAGRRRSGRIVGLFGGSGTRLRARRGTGGRAARGPGPPVPAGVDLRRALRRL